MTNFYVKQISQSLLFSVIHGYIYIYIYVCIYASLLYFVLKPSLERLSGFFFFFFLKTLLGLYELQ